MCLAADFLRSSAKVAGALSDSEDCTDIDRNVIAAEIINQMLDFVRCDDGDCIIKDYIEDYKSRSMVLGERIKILNTGEFALVQDINESGALVLKLYSGESRILDSGEVSIRVQRNRKMRLFYEENRNGSIVIFGFARLFSYLRIRDRV